MEFELVLLAVVAFIIHIIAYVAVYLGVGEYTNSADLAWAAVAACFLLAPPAVKTKS